MSGRHSGRQNAVRSGCKRLTTVLGSVCQDQTARFRPLLFDLSEELYNLRLRQVACHQYQSGLNLLHDFQCQKPGVRRDQPVESWRHADQALHRIPQMPGLANQQHHRISVGHIHLWILSIDQAESLNTAVAAGVLIHAWLRAQLGE